MGIAEAHWLLGPVQADLMKIEVGKPQAIGSRNASVIGAIDIGVGGVKIERIRLGVLSTAHGAKVASFFISALKPGGMVMSADRKEFSHLDGSGFNYSPELPPKSFNKHKFLSEIRAVFGQAEKWLPKKVKYIKLGEYLDEFVFRHNQDHNPEAAFNTLLKTALKDRPRAFRGLP